MGFGFSLLVFSHLSAQSKLYWSDWGSNKIQSANLDGTGVVDIATGLSNAKGDVALDLENNKVFWIDNSAGVLQKSNLDGSSRETLVSGIGSGGRGLDLDVANGHVYYGDYSGNYIKRANLDGSGIVTILSGLGGNRGHALDLINGKIYWTENDSNKVRRANLDGSSIEDLVTTGLSYPYGIILDTEGGVMYFSDLTNNAIYKANLDGSNRTTLISGLNQPLNLELDLANNHLYWADENTNSIERCNLDGTGRITAVSGLSMPIGLAIQLPKTHSVELNSTVNMEMIWVEPGSFTMGSPESEPARFDNEIQHEVTLSHGLYLGKYEVTQAQYEAVMAGTSGDTSATPSAFHGNPFYPVESVSYNDILVFLERLNNQQSANIPTGWEYALPTEAEWEYACRAGTSSTYSWGSSIASTNTNYNTTLGNPVTVGQYAANAWGLFDMHGNVFEWTADWSGNYETGTVFDPTGPDSGSYRVARGGSWKHNAGNIRSCCNTFGPTKRFDYCGFRLAFKKLPHVVELNSTVNMEMIWVEPGTFTMGQNGYLEMLLLKDIALQCHPAEFTEFNGQVFHLGENV